MFAVVLWVALLVTNTVVTALPGQITGLHPQRNSAHSSLRNMVTVDIEPQGWAETGAGIIQGTTCYIYASSGGYTARIKGTAHIGHGALQKFFNIQITPRIRSIYDPLYLWTDCNDAMLIDWTAVTDIYRRQIVWARDDQYALCLSTDRNDHVDFNEQTQALGGYNMILDQKCMSTVKFYSNGNIQGWWNGWTPGRRTLDGEDVPTTDDVQACEQDAEKTADDCIALVNQILEYEDAHPDGFQLEFSASVSIYDGDASADMEDEPMLAAAAPRNVVGTDSWLVNVFAAVGLCFTLFGAFRHYTQK